MESDSMGYVTIGESIEPDINKLLSRYGIEPESIGPLSYLSAFTINGGFAVTFARIGLVQGGHIEFLSNDSATLQFKDITHVPNEIYFLRLKQVKTKALPLDDLLHGQAPDTGLRYFEITDFDSAYMIIRDITSQEDPKRRAENPQRSIPDIKSDFIDSKKSAISSYLRDIHGISIYYITEDIRAASGRISVQLSEPNMGNCMENCLKRNFDLVIFPNRTTFTTNYPDGTYKVEALPQVMKSQGSFR